jgi:hypothetical protein
VCWKPRSSCWSFDLLREEFLSAPIHSPPLWFAVSVFHRATAASSRSCPHQRERATQFNPSALSPSSRRHHCPPRHLRRRWWARLPVHPPMRPILLEPSLDLVGPIQIACGPSQVLAVTRTEPPRTPPSAIVVRPLRQLLRPNSSHPQALGEHVVVPHRFPGRERGRLVGIRPAPPPPHGQGPDCKPPSSSRVFSVN